MGSRKVRVPMAEVHSSRRNSKRGPKAKPSWIARLFGRQAQNLTISAFIYTLPVSIVATAAALGWTVLIGLWVLFDLTGGVISGTVLEWLGYHPGALHRLVSEGIDRVLHVVGFITVGDGDWMVRTVQDLVNADVNWAYRKVFVVAGGIWAVLVTAYFIRIATDRRWKGPAIGRGTWLPRTTALQHMRAYFAPEIYFDLEGAPACQFSSGGHHFDRMNNDERAALVAVARRAFPATNSDDGTPATYLFGCHPHGLFTFAVWCTFLIWNATMDAVFEARGFLITVHTLASNFRVPVWRELLIGLRFSDVDRGTLEKSLGGVHARHDRDGARKVFHPAPRTTREPRLSVLVPGGAEESVQCTTPTLTLLKRKGFVRVAMSTGASIVPVYTFGETELYQPLTRHPRVLKFLVRLEKTLGVGTPLVLGRSVLNAFTPKRGRLRTIIGKPISTRSFWRRGADGIPFFTDEDVTSAHAVYVEALCSMYKRHQRSMDPNGPRELKLAA
jgi:2-acylglycerol O-acyltransferase 2